MRLEEYNVNYNTNFRFFTLHTDRTSPKIIKCRFQIRFFLVSNLDDCLITFGCQNYLNLPPKTIQNPYQKRSRTLPKIWEKRRRTIGGTRLLDFNDFYEFPKVCGWYFWTPVRWEASDGRGVGRASDETNKKKLSWRPDPHKTNDTVEWQKG